MRKDVETLLDLLSSYLKFKEHGLLFVHLSLYRETKLESGD